MVSGTEAKILDAVRKRGRASKAQIGREVGFSLEYIGTLCGYLVTKGHLTLSEGYYALPKKPSRRLAVQEAPKAGGKLEGVEPRGKVKKTRGKIKEKRVTRGGKSRVFAPKRRKGIGKKAGQEPTVEREVMVERGDTDLALKDNLDQTEVEVKNKEEPGKKSRVELIRELWEGILKG